MEFVMNVDLARNFQSFTKTRNLLNFMGYPSADSKDYSFSEEFKSGGHYGSFQVE
ncbi:MAG: hypothetical protein ACE365_00180 [Gammaproteobacteria bacterium]